MSPQIRALAEQGHIVTTGYRREPGVGRYQGNGQFGGTYSRLGLHAHPSEKEACDVHGFTQLTHLSHWGRFAFHSGSMQADTRPDHLLPLARIYWEKIPVRIGDYFQTQSFYVTTHGLVVQSLISNVVSDYWGTLVIAPCAVYREPVRFGNVRSLLGVVVSGEIAGSHACVQIEAWKDCTLEINDRRITLKKGEKQELTFDVGSCAKPTN